MLVSIHKLLISLILILGYSVSVEAQTWTLQQCLDSALVQNNSLRVSKNQMAIGQQKIKEAKGNLLPRVTANADYKYYTDLPYQLLPAAVFGGPEGQFKEAQFGVPHNINANLLLTMPVFSPKINGAVRGSNLGAELSEIQYQKTEDQVFYDVHLLFYNAQILYHQLGYIEKNLSNSRILLSSVKLLYEQTLAQKIDVEKIELQISQLLVQQANVSSNLEKVVNALKFMIGLDLTEEMEIDTTIKEVRPVDYLANPTPDIRLAMTQSRLLENEFNTLKKSQFLPNINLIGSYGTLGYGYDQAPNGFLKFFPVGFVGIQVSQPLFNRGTSNQIQQKKIELESSILMISMAEDRVNMEIKNATRQRLNASLLMETTQGQIKMAERIYNQTLVQQKQGIADLKDVLLADNALREAQQSKLNAVVELLKAELEIKRTSNNL